MIKVSKSIVLIELIFGIVLFSIILIYSLNILVSLESKSKASLSYTYKNILLETSRLFLLKNNIKNKIKFENGTLYYDNNILLDNISKFNFSSSGDISTIEICLDTKDTTCQVWKIPLI
ncbi:MAG: hypothetical protein U9O56_01890 [Campylobacterota bacterium]|nr:hypothetical protein [Campylobacterota bacterium]